MKKLVPLFFIFLVGKCCAQSKQKAASTLYFFYTKDSLVGVKNNVGKIIIPPVEMIMDQNTKEPINDALIFFESNDQNQEPHSIGKMYNRQGQFLFSPFMFDNGPDNAKEGLFRIVKNGKIGFANEQGVVVIEPTYDFASAFNYGTASYCNGCIWQTDGEHQYVSGGTTSYINYAGKQILPTTKPASPKDQQINDSTYLPYQFSYNNFEQKLVDIFYKLPLISKATFVNYADSLTENEKQLHYEIVQRPSAYFPYYHVKAFQYQKGRGYNEVGINDLNFYINKNGTNFLYVDYYGKKTAFKQWLKKYVTEAKQYLKNNPTMPNRF